MQIATAMTWMNYLAVDAMLVICSWQALIMRVHSGKLPDILQTSVLASVVWLIYSADRCLDSRDFLGATKLQRRHHWHRRWMRFLVPVWLGVAVGTVLAIAFCFPPSQWLWIAPGVVLVVWHLALGHHDGHKPSLRIRRKSLRVAGLLAYGVHLLTLDDQINVAKESLSVMLPKIPFLILSLFLVTGLFAINCHHVEALGMQSQASENRAHVRFARTESTLPPILASVSFAIASVSLLVLRPGSGALVGTMLCGLLAMTGLGWWIAKLTRAAGRSDAVSFGATKINSGTEPCLAASFDLCLAVPACIALAVL